MVKEFKGVRMEALSSAIVVLPIGCRVRVVGFDVELVVVAISVTGDCRVEYKVAFWSGGEKKESWCHPCEIEACEKPLMQRIGFAEVRDPNVDFSLRTPCSVADG